MLFNGAKINNPDKANGATRIETLSRKESPDGDPGYV